MKPAPERSWSLVRTLLARAWNARRTRCSRESASASPEASSAQRMSVVVMRKRAPWGRERSGRHQRGPASSGSAAAGWRFLRSGNMPCFRREFSPQQRLGSALASCRNLNGQMRLCGRGCYVSAEKYGRIEGYPYAIGSLCGTVFHLGKDAADLNGSYSVFPEPSDHAGQQKSFTVRPAASLRSVAAPTNCSTGVASIQASVLMTDDAACSPDRTPLTAERDPNVGHPPVPDRAGLTENDPLRSGRLVPIRIATPVGVGVDASGNPTIIYAPVLRQRPPWPALPFDPRCIASVSPRPEVIELIRPHLPGFDPEHDSLHWLWAAEVVMRSGRPKPEVQAMTYDEIAAFFAVPLNTPPLGDEVEEMPLNEAPSTGVVANETTSEILDRMWRNPRDRQRLIAAGSADKISKLIGKSKTAVIDSGPIWDEKLKLALNGTRFGVKLVRQEGRRKGQS